MLYSTQVRSLCEFPSPTYETNNICEILNGMFGRVRTKNTGGIRSECALPNLNGVFGTAAIPKERHPNFGTFDLKSIPVARVPVYPRPQYRGYGYFFGMASKPVPDTSLSSAIFRYRYVTFR